jgi:transcriptional regulator with XRE-family HTH domain
VEYQDARLLFGSRLQNIRQEKEITQEQLAERIGKSTEHISFLERGERSPSFEVIIDMAQALNISIAHLMDIDLANSVTDRLDTLAVAPVDPGLKSEVNVPSATDTPANDLARLQSAIEGIREMQRLADEYGIRDILQDNGGKILQVCILLGLKVSPHREGNDAYDNEGNEYELKTINRALAKNRGITTHHHLTTDIINKYRKVKAWYIAFYEGFELVEIYRVLPSILEPLFSKWEEKFERNHEPINNPKIPLNFVYKGELVYPKKSQK